MNYIPVMEKVKHTNGVLLERALPSEGGLRVSVGDKVEAFSEVGFCKYASKIVKIDASVKLHKKLKQGSRVSEGTLLGRSGLRAFRAPFSGFIEMKDSNRFLLSEKEDFTLLSGVWGEVVDCIERNAVLIRTQTTDIHLMACTPGFIEGELIVFPNPTDILRLQYLRQYFKNVYRKVIYVGDYVDSEFMQSAIEYGVGAVLAGSAPRETFLLAKQHGVFLGVFSGFGNIPTPTDVFSILSNVSNRFVFVQGDKNMIRVPMPEPFLIKKPYRHYIKKVVKGLRVLVFTEPDFGSVGVVEKLGKTSIVVKLEKNDRSIEVSERALVALA